MTLQFQHVALIGKYQPPGTHQRGSLAHDILSEIAAFLMKQGCHVSLDALTAQNAYADLSAHLTRLSALSVAEIGQQCDLALVVGGDGTMLGIARQLAGYKVPLIGINRGRLGFITDIPLEDYAQTLPAMLAGEFIEDRRTLMHAKVMRQNTCLFETHTLNDIAVHRGSASGMVELRVEVDGHFVANQRADGLIIASPTGATAYALSAGGPLLHPSIEGWVLVPIAPHTLSNRPIVLSNTSKVSIEVVAGRDASVSFDVQSLPSLMHKDRILVDRSEYEARFLHPKNWNYFDILRQKLRWNEGGY